ncbi:MAG TPA: DUF4230 domain-containing protein [Polyangiaceae bacterium]
MPNRSSGLYAVGAGLLALGVVVGVFGTRSLAPTLPALPPMSSAVTVVRPTPGVLAKIQDMKRLESVSFHMERVIDLSEKQSQIFGLVQTEDAILLVAAADVRAGVDLAKLGPDDVKVNLDARSATIALPPAEILGAALDSDKTYVHTRKTGVLAQRRENLETRARQEAERTLVEAAREAGILARAEENATRVVGELVRSLGYAEVSVTVRR